MNSNTQKPSSKTSRSTGEARSFRAPRSEEWENIDSIKPLEKTENEALDRRGGDSVMHAQSKLEKMLLESLKMENVIVLAGSGCSYNVKGVNGYHGPSMGSLWDAVMKARPQEKVCEIAGKVAFDVNNGNIEGFLSHIETWLSLRSDNDVSSFLKDAKRIILHECSKFIDGADLKSHKIFLHRLSRRRVRDRRLKLFTTNYDLCFERAASALGCIPVDGFSFSYPRNYDPRFFEYDIVRRSRLDDGQGTYLEGVFHLHKLHGSVNWERRDDGVIVETQNPDPERACLIYPASGKYQQSYAQPYLESISQYMAAVRQPNTCVLVVGFGFNDDHLSQPLLSAVQSNPHLRLIIVDPGARASSANKDGNKFHKRLFDASLSGFDVWFVNCNFDRFSELIPDLRSLTPSERLFQAIQSVKGIGGYDGY